VVTEAIAEAAPVAEVEVVAAPAPKKVSKGEN